MAWQYGWVLGTAGTHLSQNDMNCKYCAHRHKLKTLNMFHQEITGRLIT